MESNKVTTGELSHSKQKRIEREKRENKKKVESLVWKIVGCVAIVAVCALVGFGISRAIIKANNTVVASNDFSAQLQDNGFIKGVKANDYITLADYKNIKVPLSEIEYSDENVDADIETALNSHQVLKSEDVVAEDGNKVNIDYIGSIDGVEFDGGNTNGEGSDVTIGSGSLIDDFEQQLIGMKPGETITVEVTFPEDYQAADLAGKDAQFVTTLNGVYVNPEFDDDFVCAYYADYADTAEGYRQYLKDTNYQDNLNQYVVKYLADNTTVNKYPKKFLKNYKSTSKYTEEQSFEYMNEMYQQYYGAGFSSFEEYIGVTSKEEYEAKLDADSKEKIKTILAYQAILENEGITLTDDDLKDYVALGYGSTDEETYNSLVEEYGKGYMMLDVIEEKAIEIAKANVTVE